MADSVEIAAKMLQIKESEANMLLNEEMPTTSPETQGRVAANLGEKFGVQYGLTPEAMQNAIVSYWEKSLAGDGEMPALSSEEKKAEKLLNGGMQDAVEKEVKLSKAIEGMDYNDLAAVLNTCRTSDSQDAAKCNRAESEFAKRQPKGR